MSKQDNSILKMPLEKRKLAVASIRRSSHKQEGNQSFEIQTLAIKEYAEKKGYYLPNEFIFYDDAQSAYRKSASSRKGLNMMKEIVLSQDVSAIIFYDFSRIDRKIYSFVSEFYSDVITKKPHLKFYTTTKEDEWTPADLDVKLQLIIANGESNDKSRRTVDAQKTDLESEVRPGSTVPFGYQQIHKKLVPDENAPVVFFIYYLASWGHSIQKITNVLNEAGIPSPTKKQWRTSSIENILKNPVYMGHLSWTFRRKHISQNKHLIEHSHNAIVPGIFYKLIDVNRELKKKYNKLETPFLFGGLLVCKNCGNHLIHRNSSTRKKGIKYSYFKYFCTTCSYEMDINLLNEKLLGYIQQQLSMSVKINTGTVTNTLKEYIVSLQEQMDLLKAKEQLVLANEMVAKIHQQNQLNSVFRNVLSKLKNEIIQIEQSIREIEILLTPSELEVFLNSFQNINICKLSMTEQRLIVLNFVNEIAIHFKSENNFEFDIQFKVNPVSFITK
ncbi:recombinase family protein [Niallia sp. FSL W8-0635]|uniref:recombinase family protein n=1 Tax=Niallia sp. FSL W8-0635 TaxID=2975337 RepID=UPI0030F55502